MLYRSKYVFLRQLIYCLLLFIVLFAYSCRQSSQSIEITLHSDINNSDRVTLVFAGDVMRHLPQMNAAYNDSTNSLDYSRCFQYIRHKIESADLAICNFETVLAGKPFTGFPRFSAPDELLFALKNTGFDVMQLANNHILDRGSAGIERTLNLIRSEDMFTTGAYVDIAQRNREFPLILTVKGVKIAFLNYTYGTLGLPDTRRNIVNRLDTSLIYNDISKVKLLSPDVIVALVHWGEEYRRSYNVNQYFWADFLISKGINLIIGSHPHVVQEAVLYERDEFLVPVFYSLGNFISNQRKTNENGGVMAKIEIDRKGKYISKISYIPFYVYVGSIDKHWQYYLIPTKQYINNQLDLKIPTSSENELLIFHQNTTQKLKNLQIE